MRFATLLLIALVLPSLALAECSVLGSNLVNNPGAEAGPAANPGQPVVAVPGWEPSGGATVVTYAEWDTLSPGPLCESPKFCVLPSVGEQFFFGGWEAQTPSFTQVISIPEDCRSEPLQIVAEAWLGGLAELEDAASLDVDAIDASGGVLQSLSLGPATPAYRAGRTGTVHIESSAPLQPGAHSLIVTLHMIESDGSPPTWGVADALSVRLESGTAIRLRTWSQTKSLYR